MSELNPFQKKIRKISGLLPIWDFFTSQRSNCQKKKFFFSISGRKQEFENNKKKYTKKKEVKEEEKEYGVQCKSSWRFSKGNKDKIFFITIHHLKKEILSIKSISNL